MTAETACAEMDALLAERASGALPAGERHSLDAHLAGCRRCRAELDRYEEVFSTLRGPPDVPGEAGPDLGAATLRLWERSRRRRVLGAAGLAAAAAAALALAPGLLAKGPAGPVSDGAQLAAWEPDVDGALEASGFRQSVGQDATTQESDVVQDEETTEVDVVLAAFDAADQR